MTLCQYKYKIFIDKKCPHEALESKEFCYWHEERINKNPIEELGTKDFRNLDLTEANLQGADLREANFQVSDLGGANLQGADLREANFQRSDLGRANLQGAHLWDTNLQGSYLWDTNLQGAELWGTNLQGAELWDANLQGAYLKDANLQGAELFLTQFDNSNLWEAEPIDKIVINEIEGDDEQDNELKLIKYKEASQIYRNLKNYFRDEGIYEKSGDYYYKEKLIEKKIYRQENKGKYVGSLLLDLLCGYGEKPGRIIYSALTVIIISAILYYGIGIEAYILDENSFQVMNISYSSQLTNSENLENLVICSYFSVVTFTTLGYGDFHPMGVSRIIAMIEAFTGVFMLALFVLTMGRKMMR